MREGILQIRNNLDPNEAKLKSQLIFEKLIKTKPYKKSKNIFIYLSFNNEVESSNIIDYAINDKKNIFIPLCNTAINELIVCKMNSWEDLEVSGFGILEPKSASIRIVDRAIIDLAIVPGIAFDKIGNRIGYGAGYYDKFFASLKADICKIGICYSFQVIDYIEPSIYDVPMDYIISNKECVQV